MRDLDWNAYFESSVLGIKQFLLKEDLADLPKAQKRLRKYVCYHDIYVCVCGGGGQYPELLIDQLIE